MQASLRSADWNESIEKSGKLSIPTGQTKILVLGVDEHDRSIEHLRILTRGMKEQLARYI